MLKSNAPNKILAIQYLRGIAAMGVVLCHYSSLLTTHPLITQIFRSGMAGVYLFFLISGFIIVYSLVNSGYKPAKFFTFLLKRSIRIDPSYYMAVVLTLGLFLILPHVMAFKGDQITFIPGQFLAHLFYVVQFTNYKFYNTIFWTLAVEFQFYVLIGLAYFLRDNQVYRAVILILFIALSFIPMPKSYFIVFHYATIFAAGISLVTFYQNKHWRNALLPFLSLCIATYQFGWLTGTLLFFACWLILYFKLTIKPLGFLGDISYSLYLTHNLVQVVFLGIIKRIGINFYQSQLVYFCIELVLAIVVANIFYLLIEQPSVKFSKHIFYNRQKSSISTSL